MMTEDGSVWYRVEDTALIKADIPYAAALAPHPRPQPEDELVRPVIPPPPPMPKRPLYKVAPSPRRLRPQVLKRALLKLRHNTAELSEEWLTFWPRNKVHKFVDKFWSPVKASTSPSVGEAWVDHDLPRPELPKGLGTARKAVRVKRDRVAFETLSQCTGEYAPVPAPRRRLESLLVKLRVAIRHLKARRLPPRYRMKFLVTYIAAIERYNIDLVQNLFHIGEAQGLLDFKFGINTESKIYLDEAINKVVSSVKHAIGEHKKKFISGVASVSGILITAAAGGSRTSWITGILASLACIGVMTYSDTVEISKEFDSVVVKKPVSTNENTAKADGPTPLEYVQTQEIDEHLASGLTLLFQSLKLLSVCLISPVIPQ